MFTGPRAVLLGILLAAMFFGPRAAAEGLCNPIDPCDAIVLYTPQGAPAGEDALRSDEADNPQAQRVVRRPMRRIPAMSARRTSILLTLYLAVQMNSPSFKAGAATMPQAGATIGLLPGVALASGARFKPASLDRTRVARSPGSRRLDPESLAALTLRQGLTTP